ncbi:MAG TPA: efflux RND transporter periplasmic adaptor subunit [Methylibium sp.]
MSPSPLAAFSARPASRVAALAIVAAGALLAACSKSDPPPEPVRAVRTMQIASEAAGNTLEYAAEVKARVESRLGFRVGGKLMRRAVNLGDTVKAGQLLAQLDARDLVLGEQAAKANLSAAQVSFDLAQADFKRYKDLRDQDFIGAAELDRREATLKSAKAALEQARAQANVQGNQAGYADLLADAAGVITGVDAEPGQVVAAGTPVLRLAQDGPRDVVFSVPEDKVQNARALVGKAGGLKVKLWGSNEQLPAMVREIAAAADPATRTFLVKADVGRNTVKLGQTATVSLDLPRTDGITKLPLTALMEQQGKTSVWLLDKASMTVKPQVVQVSGAEGNAAIVTAGLSPGQLVVTGGVHVLTPGQKVKLYGVADATNDAAAAQAATEAMR